MFSVLCAAAYPDYERRYTVSFSVSNTTVLPFFVNVISVLSDSLTTRRMPKSCTVQVLPCRLWIFTSQICSFFISADTRKAPSARRFLNFAGDVLSQQGNRRMIPSWPCKSISLMVAGTVVRCSMPPPWWTNSLFG